MILIVLHGPWPVREQWIDLLHKGVFAFVTGYLCDKWIMGSAVNA